jgi:hypothetical protein
MHAAFPAAVSCLRPLCCQALTGTQLPQPEALPTLAAGCCRCSSW